MRLVMPAVFCAVTLAGCGSSSHPRRASTSRSSPAPMATTAGTDQAFDPRWSNAGWAACMRDHRVPINGPDSYGDISFSTQPMDRATYLEAQRSCVALWAPSARVSVDQVLRLQDYRRKLQACLQANTSNPQTCHDRYRNAPALDIPRPQRT
jgi:hypothetical protein